MIPIAAPYIANEEIEAVVTVLRSRHLAQGHLVDEFEDRLAAIVGTKHAVAVSSGTAALHTALLAHGIGPGDEVITSPFSFIATANSVLYTGGRPIFADIRPDTYTLDPNQIESKISSKTRAIMPVHLYGCPADMPAICKIARAHGLAVIEDAAQALGAGIGERQAGSFGTSCFSFYATKNITTAEGGAVLTDDDEIADRARKLRNHGQLSKYEHGMLGYNYRMTDIQAAIGLAQLNRLETFTNRRATNALFLTRNLPAGVAQFLPDGYRHVYHQYTVRVPGNRDEKARALNEAGVGTGVHYPIPIHKQPLYIGLGYNDSLPVAEQAARHVLSLPVHPMVSDKDLAVIVEAANKYLF